MGCAFFSNLSLILRFADGSPLPIVLRGSPLFDLDRLNRIPLITTHVLSLHHILAQTYLIVLSLLQCNAEMLISLLLPLLSFFSIAFSSCECGFRATDTNEYFTHAIFNQFNTYEDATSLNINPKGRRFAKDWIIQSWVATPRLYEPLPWRVNEQNVWIKNGQLKLRQVGYSMEDAKKQKSVSGASIVSRVDTIYHGSFRAKMRITGAEGGSVAAWYWYHVSPALHIINFRPNQFSG